MPSRIEVADTALTAEASTPAVASASRVHSQIRAQLAVVSKTWEPGTPGRAAWLYSRWPIATWWPSRSNSTARQEPVPASMASSSSPLMRRPPAG